MDDWRARRHALSVGQAAEILGVSETHVRRMVRLGHLRRVPHMGRRVVIPPRAVEELLGEVSGDDAP